MFDCTQKHEFKQSDAKPTSEVKFHTHHDIIDDLKSGLGKEFLFEEHYFNHVKSNLAVIFPGEDILNPHDSRHFIVAPRKQEKIRQVESKWQDKQLQGKIFNLLTNDTVYAVMIPIDDQKDALFKNHELFPYFTCDSMITAKLGVERCRRKFMKDRLNTIEILQENGLKNTINTSTKRLPQSKLRAILVHLHLNDDFDVVVLKDKHIEKSNLFIWFLIDFGGRDPILKEYCLVTNCYMWLTFKDISCKHDIQESEPYNMINSSLGNQHYQNTKCMLMDENVRTSHVAINQLCELDALLHQLVQKLFDIEQIPSTITMKLAPATWVLNTYYWSRFGKHCLECDKHGFYKLYSHYYDNYHSSFEKYQKRDERFVGLLQFMQISQATLSTTNIQLPKLSTFTSAHYWCCENASWNHWPVSDRQTINKYVQKLQKMVQYVDLKHNEALYGFMQQLRKVYFKYITNHYIYSLYYVKSMKIIPLKILTKQFGYDVHFEDGFELIVVIQPQLHTNEACIVYVQECAVVCHDCISLIQLHNHQSKEAVVVCVGLPCFVVILRRLPPKVLKVSG